MLTGPICWLQRFLNGTDDPETPYLSEFSNEYVSLRLQKKFGTDLRQSTSIKDNNTEQQTPSQYSMPDFEVWQSHFYSKLGENRLGIALIALQQSPQGKVVVERMKNGRFPPHFFVQIHKPYLAIWGTGEFGTIYPDVPSELYQKYISMFLDLYDISFYEFDLVFLLESSHNIAGIVEFYESTCASDPVVLREHLRLRRKDHQSSLYNMHKL